MKSEDLNLNSIFTNSLFWIFMLSINILLVAAFDLRLSEIFYLLTFFRGDQSDLFQIL